MRFRSHDILFFFFLQYRRNQVTDWHEIVERNILELVLTRKNMTMYLTCLMKVVYLETELYYAHSRRVVFCF